MPPFRCAHKRAPARDLMDAGHLGRPAVEGPQRRQAPGDVQEPARQPGKGLEVRPCPGAGAERPMSAMNTGTTGRVRAMTRAEVRSTTALQHSTATGTMTAGPPGADSGRSSLEAVDPLDRSRGQLGAAAAGRGGARRRRRPTSSARMADSTLVAVRRPLTSTTWASRPGRRRSPPPPPAWSQAPGADGPRRRRR